MGDPTKAPTMKAFMTSIAQLGGYINKKSQGPPGSKTIWRGMSRFETIFTAKRLRIIAAGKRSAAHGVARIIAPFSPVLRGEGPGMSGGIAYDARSV